MLLIGPLHGVNKVVARDRLAIVTSKVFIHSGAKGLFAEQRVHHPNDFSAFFIDGRRIKVTNFLVAFRANWMRHRAIVFRKLCCSQAHNIVNSFDRTCAGCFTGAKPLGHHVCRKLLIPKNR